MVGARKANADCPPPHSEILKDPWARSRGISAPAKSKRPPEGGLYSDFYLWRRGNLQHDSLKRLPLPTFHGVEKFAFPLAVPRFEMRVRVPCWSQGRAQRGEQEDRFTQPLGPAPRLLEGVVATLRSFRVGLREAIDVARSQPHCTMPARHVDIQASQ